MWHRSTQCVVLVPRALHEERTVSIHEQDSDIHTGDTRPVGRFTWLRMHTVCRACIISLARLVLFEILREGTALRPLCGVTGQGDGLIVRQERELDNPDAFNGISIPVPVCRGRRVQVPRSWEFGIEEDAKIPRTCPVV